MKFYKKLNEILVKIGILQETPFFYDSVKLKKPIDKTREQ